MIHRILTLTVAPALIILAGMHPAYGQYDGATAVRRQEVHPNGAPKLEGTHWKLVELGGNIPAGKAGEGDAYVVLNSDGQKLSGSSGCNRLVGGYKLQQRRLHFTPIALTRMACPEPLMKQEQAFVEALNATTSYLIVGDTLELRNGRRVLAKFRSSSESNPSVEPSSPPTAENDLPDNWLGRWIGPEGTYLHLSKNGDKYVVEIRSLDGLKTYEGVQIGDRIQFTRDGTEFIRAGTGIDTGMKWLLDKKNCLIIKTGEGFCRD
jgi:heat shock protein HslJ